MNSATTLQALRERLLVELVKKICDEPPLPWRYAERPGEGAFFDALRTAGHVRQPVAGKWELTPEGERFLIVPELFNEEAERVLNLIADYDIDHRTGSDYHEWMLGIDVRSQMSANGKAEKDRILGSLAYWYLEAMVEPLVQFRLNHWGWLASKYRPRAFAAIDGILKLFRQRCSRREFRGSYCFDDLRQHAALEGPTDSYLAEQMVDGFRLGKIDGTGIWQVPTAQLEELLEYESAYEFLTARAVRLAKGLIQVEAHRHGIHVRTLSEQFGPPPSTGPMVVSAWTAALKVIKDFKHLVENRDIWRVLWDGDRPREEAIAQSIFYVVASSFCKVAGIDITQEAGTGRGPVDFKLASGSGAPVMIEVKLSNNKSLVHGYETQLELYKRAEDTPLGVFLVIDVGEMGTKLDKIRAIHDAIQQRGERPSEIIVVNAAKKSSASKA